LVLLKTNHDISVLPSIESECPIQPARRVKKTTWSDHIPVLLLGSWISRKFGGRGPSAHELEREYEAIMKRTPSNVPLEILNHLHQYVDDCLAAGIIRAPYDGMVAGDLVALLSAGNELRRIRSTPLPFAYQVHLRLAAWLYFIFFPVTMYETLKWAMVFAVIVLSFIYFGLLDIARDL
jgi:putative membrane protein